MRKDIIDVHITPAGLSRFTIRVAVESDPGKFIAFQGSMTSLSEYAIEHVARTGKELSQDEVNEYFYHLNRSLEYVVILPARISQPDSLSSLSDLYEQAKDLAIEIAGGTPGEKTGQLFDVLKQIRDLAAPAMVRRTVEGV